MRRFLPARLFVWTSLVLSAGCGQSDGEADEENAVVAEDPGPPALVIASPAAPVPAAPVAAVETAAAPVARPPASSAERFPLIKTVEQTLRQPGPQGWIVSRSSLEVSLSIAVDDAEAIRPVSEGAPAAGRRMCVQFDRVRFVQEVPGQARLEYDSAAAAAAVPPAAACYAGLKDNGFEFSISEDGQFIEAAGLDRFVNGCLRSVAPERQPQMRAQFGNPSGAEVVASFVDENIGALPADVREGGAWVRDRQFGGPVPMHSVLRYTLRRLTPDLAEIDVQGSLAPLAASTGSSPRDVVVTLRGGQSLGSCSIDRRTGLPVYSHSQQALDMLVRAADGLEFEQSKSIVTTIRPALAARGKSPGSALDSPRR